VAPSPLLLTEQKPRCSQYRLFHRTGAAHLVVRWLNAQHLAPRMKLRVTLGFLCSCFSALFSALQSSANDNVRDNFCKPFLPTHSTLDLESRLLKLGPTCSPYLWTALLGPASHSLPRPHKQPGHLIHGCSFCAGLWQ
jgi:hypothetical protein